MFHARGSDRKDNEIADAIQSSLELLRLVVPMTATTTITGPQTRHNPSLVLQNALGNNTPSSSPSSPAISGPCILTVENYLDETFSATSPLIMTPSPTIAPSTLSRSSSSSSSFQPSISKGAPLYLAIDPTTSLGDQVHTCTYDVCNYVNEVRAIRLGYLSPTHKVIHPGVFLGKCGRIHVCGRGGCIISPCQISINAPPAQPTTMPQHKHNTHSAQQGGKSCSLPPTPSDDLMQQPIAAAASTPAPSLSTSLVERGGWVAGTANGIANSDAQYICLLTREPTIRPSSAFFDYPSASQLKRSCVLSAIPRTFCDQNISSRRAATASLQSSMPAPALNHDANQSVAANKIFDIYNIVRPFNIPSLSSFGTATTQQRRFSDNNNNNSNNAINSTNSAFRGKRGARIKNPNTQPKPKQPHLRRSNHASSSISPSHYNTNAVDDNTLNPVVSLKRKRVDTDSPHGLPSAIKPKVHHTTTPTPTSSCHLPSYDTTPKTTRVLLPPPPHLSSPEPGDAIANGATTRLLSNSFTTIVTHSNGAADADADADGVNANANAEASDIHRDGIHSFDVHVCSFFTHSLSVNRLHLLFDKARNNPFLGKKADRLAESARIFKQLFYGPIRHTQRTDLYWAAVQGCMNDLYEMYVAKMDALFAAGLDPHYYAIDIMDALTLITHWRQSKRIPTYSMATPCAKFTPAGGSRQECGQMHNNQNHAVTREPRLGVCEPLIANKAYTDFYAQMCWLQWNIICASPYGLQQAPTEHWRQGIAGQPKASIPQMTQYQGDQPINGYRGQQREMCAAPSSEPNNSNNNPQGNFTSTINAGDAEPLNFTKCCLATLHDLTNGFEFAGKVLTPRVMYITTHAPPNTDLNKYGFKKNWLTQGLNQRTKALQSLIQCGKDQFDLLCHYDFADCCT